MSSTANPLASADPPEFVIGLPADFRDLPLTNEPATWDATAAFLDLVPVPVRVPRAGVGAPAGLLRAARDGRCGQGRSLPGPLGRNAVDNQPWLLVVALSSPTPADWESYQAIMAVICRSIRLLDPADRVD